jgi:hypothetical protein
MTLLLIGILIGILAVRIVDFVDIITFHDFEDTLEDGDTCPYCEGSGFVDSGRCLSCDNGTWVKVDAWESTSERLRYLFRMVFL